MSPGRGPGPEPAGRPTWRALWAEGEAALGDRLEARRIVERASGYDGASLILHLDEPVPARAMPFARDMVARRRTGEPLQYVVGRWGFRTLDLLVDRRVLIPRPETELVVEVAVRELRALGLDRPPIVADLGTGSGAIALSLAVETDASEVWATDVSADALAVARANLAGLGSRPASKVRLAEGSWFDALPADLMGRLDLIVANPPYIATDEVLPSDVVDWEPHGALFAGATGFEHIETIVRSAWEWLARPGVLVVEITPARGDAAMALAREVGFGSVEVRPDLGSLLRALVGRV